MVKKCIGCQSRYVCWNWVAPTSLTQRWSHECWACGNCFSTPHKVTDGIPYKKLNTLESKTRVEMDRQAIICHKLKNNEIFDRECGAIDKDGKWTRSESDWEQVTCNQCLAQKPLD